METKYNRKGEKEYCYITLHFRNDYSWQLEEWFTLKEAKKLARKLTSDNKEKDIEYETDNEFILIKKGELIVVIIRGN